MDSNTKIEGELNESFDASNAEELGHINHQRFQHSPLEESDSSAGIHKIMFQKDSSQEESEDDDFGDIPLARKLSRTSSASSSKSHASSDSSELSKTSLESVKLCSKVGVDMKSASKEVTNLNAEEEDGTFRNNVQGTTVGSKNHSKSSSTSSVNSAVSSDSVKETRKLNEFHNNSSQDVSRLGVEIAEMAMENIAESSYVSIYKYISSPTKLESANKADYVSEKATENTENENSKIKYDNPKIQSSENKSNSISVSSFESNASSKSSQVSEKRKESEFVDSDKQTQDDESKKSKMNSMNDKTGETVISNINNTINKMKEQNKFVKPKRTESEDDVFKIPNGDGSGNGSKESLAPVCHSCGVMLQGALHYKCLNCPDYILCRTCRVNRLQKKIHLEHSFRPISSIDRTPMVGRKSLTSRKSSTISNVSDVVPLSPKDSLPSSPTIQTRSKGDSATEKPLPKDTLNSPNFAKNEGLVISPNKTALDRTETVPLKTTSSSSSNSLQSNTSSSDNDSIEGIPFTKKSSRKSSTTNVPSLTSNTSKVTSTPNDEISLNQETTTSDSNNAPSSDGLSKNTAPVANNILDILDTVQLDETAHVTKTESPNSESSLAEKLTISGTAAAKSDNPFNDNARDQFFASLSEPAKPALIPPLSPSLKVTSKKADDVYDNLDEAAQVDVNDGAGPPMILSQSSEIQDPSVLNIKELSQVESGTLLQTSNDIKDEGQLSDQQNEECAVGTTNGLDNLPIELSVAENFQNFYEATNFAEANVSFSKVLNALQIKPGPFHTFFPKLKALLLHQLPYKYKAIWDVLEKKSKLSVYGKGIAKSYSVLVIGAGPCGLRTAIETQFLGAQTVVAEKRDNFTRNNILKLWKFVVEDLKMMGVKNVLKQFCTGSVNHIGIKTLQLFLAKICLLMGVEISTNVSFEELSSPNDSGKGWSASFYPKDHKLNNYIFTMLVDASGKNVPIDGFGHHSLNAKLCIAVTANFINKRTKEEQLVKEIPGLSRQYDQEFFSNIEKDKGIALENIVYYKGETHYFVMTATKKSLLQRGVLVDNENDRSSLLQMINVNQQELYKYAIDAAEYSTEKLSQKLPTKEFALDHKGKPDVSVFDFTDLYAGTNACRVKLKSGYKLIMASVGDSLVQPFWPEGTGCARGFLSGMNAAWMLRRFAEGTKTLDILAERENLYKMLKQTTDATKTVLKDKHKLYTIDPATRYRYTPVKIDNSHIKPLYEKFANEDGNLRGKLRPTVDFDLDDALPLPEPSPIVRSKEMFFRKISTVVDLVPRMHRAEKRKESNIGIGGSRSRNQSRNQDHHRKQMRRSNSSV